MPMQDPTERYLHSAVMIMLSLAMFAAGSATVIHWLSPVHRPLDMIVPPSMCAVFASLLIALMRRPHWVFGIARTSLLASGLALAAPSWFYSVQAALTPGLQLIRIFPPISSLLVVLMVMVMLFLPARYAFRVAVVGWVLIALPVLVYLFAHPLEMWTPRGRDLLMAYGPAIIMVVVLLPVQRGLTGQIARLVLERGRMETMINRDPLTRLYNRRVSEHVLQTLLAGQATAGVLMFDMDRFKAINDTHGHLVGDQVLQAVAKRCKVLLRRDECVSRWGGEEFLVIVPNVDASDLQQMAERLRLAIAGVPVEPVGQIAASFGATMTQDGDSLASVMQRVDKALYQAKKRGGNCVVSAQVVFDEVLASDQPGLNDSCPEELRV